ncbi:MAG: OmpA family protein [Paracoccaceae bacterium]
MMRSVIIALALLCASPAAALDLMPPNAVITKSQTEAAGSARIPKAPWSNTPTPLTEGRIDRQAARIPQSDLTTLQLIQPIRDKLKSTGYSEVFSCADASCGGFDFRFQLDLLPAPDMYVDLGDYRYLVMEKGSGAPHTVAILASKSRSDGYVHVTQIFEANAPIPVQPTQQIQANDALDPMGIVERLTATGHAILPDLDFETGSAELGAGPYGSLQALALWLEGNPSARIILVGHTDSVGSLEANTALSTRRARSVAQRLATEFDVDTAQIEAAGAGYLSPVASNLSEEGRAANRRVEVVLLSLN